MKKSILTLLTTLAFSIFLKAQDLSGVVSRQVTTVKSVAKNVMIAGFVIGVVIGVIVIMTDFKNNENIKRVLISILVVCLIFGAVAGLVSLANAISW